PKCSRCSRWFAAPSPAVCRTCPPHPTAAVAADRCGRIGVHGSTNVAPTRSVPMSSNPVAETVASLMPRAKAELTELVAFKSVADFDQYPKSESEGAANWVADALRTEGFQDVALLDTPDGTQSVYGFLPGPEGAKTVLLYAHYDV